MAKEKDFSEVKKKKMWKEWDRKKKEKRKE